MKLCKACGRNLDDSMFAKHVKRGRVYLRYLCRECMSAHKKEYRSRESTKLLEREYRERNKEKETARSVNWAKKNKELIKNRRLMREYGVDMAWFCEQFKKQEGTCAICKCAIDQTPTRNTHVDHDHSTGLVRGILCQSCNKGLGQFRDSPETLISASDYLKESRG